MKELEEEKRIARQTKELLVNAHSKELAIIEKEHKTELKVWTLLQFVPLSITILVVIGGNIKWKT